MNSEKKTNKLVNYFALAVLAFLFLLVFSNGTSPLTSNYYGMDSAFFMFFGKAMKHGYIPYIDLFDHKGPYFYFLQELGQIICEGRFGAFIIQLLNLFISLSIVDKIILYIKKDLSFIRRLLFQIPLLIVLSFTFREGNMTEEYSLPLLFYSLYLFIKYLKENVNYEHKPLYAFIYGLFIGILAFSRITNAAFICSIVLMITIILIIKKNYKNLIQNILLFVAGLIISFMPLFIYFSTVGALNEMINSVFVFAYKYSMHMSLEYRLNTYFTFDHNILLLIVASSIIYLLIIKKNRSYELLFSCISFIATFLATFLGFSFTHYFVLVLPNMLFTIYLIMNYYDKSKLLIKNKYVCVVLGIVLISSLIFVGEAFGKNILQMADYSLSEKKENYYSDLAKLDTDIGNYIPENDKYNVWGYGIKARFYLRTNTFPCIKYYDYLDQFLQYEELNKEIVDLYNANKPKWLIISKEKEKVPVFIEDDLTSDYLLVAENSAYYLYNRVK